MVTMEAGGETPTAEMGDCIKMGLRKSKDETAEPTYLPRIE